MARGVFSGLIWGVVVAGAGAGGLSLAYPDFKPAGRETAMVEPAMDAEMAKPAVNVAVEETPEKTSVAEDAPVTMQTDDPESEAMETAAQEAAEPEVMEPEPVEPEMAETPDAADAAPAMAEPEASEPVVAQAAAPVAEPVEAEEPAVAETDTMTVDAETEASTGLAEVTPEAMEPEAPEVVTEPAVAEPEKEPETSVTEEIIAALPKPEGTVGDLAPEVKTNRLPSLAEPDESDPDSPPAAAPPPIERFAAEFKVDEGKPLMAIVLMDEGDSALGIEALASFPYPITFAVDASLPNAIERMKLYRNKGFEVMALSGLPQGATASDAEVAMAAYLKAVPEAVAILETPDVSLQASREVADQITKIMLESGHGLVLQANGLNTAQKLARREGIPSATVFRDFDGKDQKAGVIRRFLDQAAFKADQEGGVIMLGRLRAETISALLIWGLADRASRVALVPVSAVLLQGDFTR